ncbi:MAG: D-aminoacyl-tRNA deacylase [Synergistaceae bacterium]|nr:D-aminoacyl-tRNA deacylase [Synergistaceae bacterium]
MKALLQRVDYAEVRVAGKITGKIDAGLCVLLGVVEDDTEKDLTQLAEKVCNLRIFDDENGVMNRSLLDTGGQMLVVSQFTLCADCKKGRRPSWHLAAKPEFAKDMYNRFTKAVQALGIKTQNGIFQTEMKVSLCNNGPVTIMLDTKE